MPATAAPSTVRKPRSTVRGNRSKPRNRLAPKYTKKICTITGVPRKNHTYTPARIRRGRSFDICASAEMSPKSTPNDCASTAIQTVRNMACHVALSGKIR